MTGTRLLAMLGWSALSGLLCAPAFGNDSTAELSIGGLVFTKSADISLASFMMSSASV